MNPSATPLVSVVTVCRNAASVIRQCIDSVNSQTYAAIEHIVVDGASGDGTQRLIEASRLCPESRVSQFVSEPDAGIYDAMNKGLQLATGDYVYFLNADDYFFGPTSVESVVRVFAERQVSILQTRILLTDPSTGHASLFAPPRGLRRTSPMFRGIYQQAIWARRVLFDTHGLFDISFRYCGDVEWLMRVMKEGATVSSSDVLTTVFLLGGASSNFEGVKAEQRRAEMLHYSRFEWTVCKLARRVSRPIERFALLMQA